MSTSAVAWMNAVPFTGQVQTPPRLLHGGSRRLTPQLMNVEPFGCIVFRSVQLAVLSGPVAVASRTACTTPLIVPPSDDETVLETEAVTVQAPLLMGGQLSRMSSCRLKFTRPSTALPRFFLVACFLTSSYRSSMSGGSI